MKRPAAVHYAAFGLILLNILMTYVFYQNTGNLNSPIVEYEFAKNEQDVKNIFIDDDNNFKRDVINGVKDQNIVDYAYMLFYTALLIFAFSKIKKTDTERNKVYVFGIIFSVVALVADIFENILLFRISELLTERVSFSEYVDRLFVITRIKWFSLAFAFFILSFHYIRYNFTGKLFAVISALPIIAAAASFFPGINQEYFIPVFTLGIVIAFVILMIWVFISHKINKKVDFYKI